MKYAELQAFSHQDRMRILAGLSEAEIADLRDEKPYEMAGFTPIEDRQYFDNIDALHTYLLKNYVPESRPWEADEAASHELAHANCALKVGAVGVKYYAVATMDPATRTSIFTHSYGPATLPNLAWAAIAAHPYTSTESIMDRRNWQSYGYNSREHVAERIALWSRKDNGLYIPEPQSVPVSYP